MCATHARARDDGIGGGVHVVCASTTNNSKQQEGRISNETRSNGREGERVHDGVDKGARAPSDEKAGSMQAHIST